MKQEVAESSFGRLSIESSNKPFYLGNFHISTTAVDKFVDNDNAAALSAYRHLIGVNLIEF
jgi:hypothetical protein